LGIFEYSAERLGSRHLDLVAGEALSNDVVSCPPPPPPSQTTPIPLVPPSPINVPKRSTSNTISRATLTGKRLPSSDLVSLFVVLGALVERDRIVDSRRASLRHAAAGNMIIVFRYGV